MTHYIAPGVWECDVCEKRFKYVTRGVAAQCPYCPKQLNPVESHWHNPPCGHKEAECVIGNYWKCGVCDGKPAIAVPDKYIAYVMVHHSYFADGRFKEQHRGGRWSPYRRYAEDFADACRDRDYAHLVGVTRGTILTERSVVIDDCEIIE